MRSQTFQNSCHFFMHQFHYILIHSHYTCSVRRNINIFEREVVCRTSFFFEYNQFLLNIFRILNTIDFGTYSASWFNLDIYLYSEDPHDSIKLYTMWKIADLRDMIFWNVREPSGALWNVPKRSGT